MSNLTNLNNIGKVNLTSTNVNRNALTLCNAFYDNKMLLTNGRQLSGFQQLQIHFLMSPEPSFEVVINPNVIWKMRYIKDEISRNVPGFDEVVSTIVQMIYNTQRRKYNIIPTSDCILRIFFREKTINQVEAEGQLPGQNLHRNVTTLTNKGIKYTSVTQTLIYLKNPQKRSLFGLVNTNMSQRPTTYFIPKYTKSNRLGGRYVRTPIHSNLPGNMKQGFAVENLPRRPHKMNSFKAQAGTLVQFISFMGYHHVSNIQIPQTRRMINTHLFMQTGRETKYIQNAIRPGMANKQQFQNKNLHEVTKKVGKTPRITGRPKLSNQIKPISSMLTGTIMYAALETAPNMRTKLNAYFNDLSRQYPTKNARIKKQINKLPEYGFNLSGDKTRFKYRYESNNARNLLPSVTRFLRIHS